MQSIVEYVCAMHLQNLIFVRIKVNGTILQTCANSPSGESGLCMFGARTHNNAILASMDKDQVKISENDTPR